MNVSFLYVMFYLQNVVEKKLSQMILDKKLHGELTVLQLFWNNNKVVFTIFYWIVLSFLRKVLKTAKLQGSFVCGWTWLQIISNQISAILLWKFSSKMFTLSKLSFWWRSSKVSRRYESKILILDYLLSNIILNRLLRLVKICQALAWAFLNNLLSLSKRLNCLVLCFNFSLNFFIFVKLQEFLIKVLECWSCSTRPQLIKLTKTPWNWFMKWERLWMRCIVKRKSFNDSVIIYNTCMY